MSTLRFCARPCGKHLSCFQRILHKSMSSAPPCLFKVLGVALVMMTIMGTADLSRAQESTGQRLERVEVNPPERRTRPTQARTSQDSGYEDTEAQDRQPSDSQSSRGDRGTGAPSAMPSLAVVTDKGSVSSMGSASLPSQVQIVTRQEIDRLPVRTFGDLFRTVAGVRSYSQGRGDVGETMQIRGNSGGHGIDTGIYVDGVPQNFSSTSGIGNGGADVAWLTPEMVERIEVIKGPFSPLYGNHAQAGVINIITKKSDPSPSLAVSGASFGGFRAAPVISSDTWIPTPFLVNEYQTLDGYRENSHYKRFSSFSKVTMPVGAGDLSVRFNYYRSDWGSANYPLMKQVRSGVWPRRRAINPQEGGEQRRWTVVTNYAPTQNAGGLYFTAYVDAYKREHSFTSLPSLQETSYPYDTVTYGGRAFYNAVFGDFASLLLGIEGRYDDAISQSFLVKNRQRTSTVSDLDLMLSNTALFAEAQVKPVRQVKIVAGMRKDYFANKVENQVKPANSGTGYPHTFNPKIGMVITPIANINLFGNIGIGFRAPAASDMSPTAGNKRFDLDVAKTVASDLGFNATFLDSIFIAFDWYQTDMEKEVRMISSQPFNVGDSQRNGFEVMARYYPSDLMNLFAEYSWVDAKVKNPATAGQEYVTGVAKYAIKAGMDFTFDLTPSVRLLASLYGEYIGEQPFYFGSSAIPRYPPTYVVYHGKVAWEGRNWSLFGTAKYQPQEFSSNRIGTAQDAADQYDFTFTPEPLWDLSGGVKYTF